ncbi:MAG: hypothetical protein CUN52_12670 [Phototrophicales bacterium]|nr:MAG: hypothetical protein CUN52_12670 [Phototrophicales bacterium]
MTTHRIKYLLLSLGIIALFTSIITATIAQDCPMVIEDILNTVGDICADTGRNQVCYGNSNITVTQASDYLEFNTVGDITDLVSIKNYSLSPYNAQDNLWGIALMKVQANIPDTIPGQNVTLLAFGDIVLEDATEGIYLNATIDTNTPVFIAPADERTDDNTVTTLTADTPIQIIGRNNNSDWFLVHLGETANYPNGWVQRANISPLGDDRLLLPIYADDVLMNTDASLPRANPMSIFRLKTGIGETNCQQLPPDGVLIQTPQGIGRVQMTVNGVRMSFGSLVYLTSALQSLIVFVLDGTATVSVGTDTQLITTGGAISIPMTETMTAPTGTPNSVIPYQDIEALFGINLDNLLSVGNSNIFNAPLDEFKDVNWDDMHQDIISTFAPNGAMDGVYFFTLIDFQMLIPPTFDDPSCKPPTEPYKGFIQSFTFAPDTLYINYGSKYPPYPVPKISPNMWGDAPEKHDSLLTPSPTPKTDYAITFTAISPTSLQLMSSYLTAISNSKSLCKRTYIGTWIAPLGIITP